MIKKRNRQIDLSPNKTRDKEQEATANLQSKKIFDLWFGNGPFPSLKTKGSVQNEQL